MPIWKLPICSLPAREFKFYSPDSQIGIDGEFQFRMRSTHPKAQLWRSATSEHSRELSCLTRVVARRSGCRWSALLVLIRYDPESLLNITVPHSRSVQLNLEK